MSIVTLLVLALCGGLCAWLSLRHAMHMFQLNSYQDLPTGIISEPTAALSGTPSGWSPAP